ncbi:MAG: four helix bundle protein [Bacteroidetes bacterium CG18_big_fil_WC_8_21_14_2_50_41_14]|nr:MAG: four helix bundle protein [Bacteroidetes bacterium CG18_big_fil_WC_8_21_14_2_50_41_14]
MYKSFRDMPVWIKAHDLAVDVFNMTVDLPRAEDYGLTSQIRRSANSSPANIAEGFGRKTSKDKSHFYIVARGSAYETQNHLLYGNRVKYFSDDDTKRFFDEYANLIFELNKIMKSFD